MSHEFSEAAFGEGALLEPNEVFLGEVIDWNSSRRVFFLAEHSEGHVGAVNFREQVAEVLAVDFCEVHVWKRDACGVAGVS